MESTPNIKFNWHTSTFPKLNLAINNYSIITLASKKQCKRSFVSSSFTLVKLLAEQGPNPQSLGTQQFSQGLVLFSDMRCDLLSWF